MDVTLLKLVGIMSNFQAISRCYEESHFLVKYATIDATLVNSEWTLLSFRSTLNHKISC